MDDRQKWDLKHASGTPGSPSVWIVQQSGRFSLGSRALDIAGGLGRHSLLLAELGFHVTWVDISPVAHERLGRASIAGAGSITRELRDLASDPLPEGPFHLVVCTYFLERRLFPFIPGSLHPGGTFLFQHPTVRNLERNSTPSRRFLLAEGEARSLVEHSGLVVTHEFEGWTEAGTHEARLIARKPGH